MSEKIATQEEIANATQAIESGNAAGFECIFLLPTPYGIQAVALVAAAKNAGKIRDLTQCKALAGDAGALGKVLGDSALAGLIAGKTAECACEKVFGSSESPPASSPTPGGTPKPCRSEGGCRTI